MTKVLNFKKLEVVAESKEAAIAKVEESLFHINGDATQAYKNWKAKQTKGITERDVKEFMLEYLEKKGKSCPGTGYLITVESAVADSRSLLLLSPVLFLPTCSASSMNIIDGAYFLASSNNVFTFLAP